MFKGHASQNPLRHTEKIPQLRTIRTAQLPGTNMTGSQTAPSAIPQFVANGCS